MSTRRDFFKVLFAAGVALAVPVILGETLPTIYGDGVHDDTAGMQAAYSGKPFIARNDIVVVRGGVVCFGKGTFRMSKTASVS